MDATSLQQLAMEETYESVREIVKATALKFIGRYGGNAEEQLADANYYFCLAYNSWDPDRIPDFAIWCSRKIWYELLEGRRKWATHNAREGSNQDIALDTASSGEPRHFDYRDISIGLSGDAKLVLRLLVETPKEIVDQLKRETGATLRYRAAIRKYMGELGWPTWKTTAAFNEIKEALQC